MKIAAVLCTTIPPISCLILSHFPVCFSNSACNPPMAYKFIIYCLSYIFVNLCCNINCSRITPLSPLEYVTLLSTHTVCITHTCTHAHIRLAPQTSDLFIHSLSHPDLMLELTVVRLISAESYTIGCLFTLSLDA